MQQATVVVPTNGWQSTQASGAYPGNEYAVLQGQLPDGQMSQWDPSMQANRSTFVSVPSSFPGQTYTAPGIPGYPSVDPPGSTPLQQPVRGPTYTLIWCSWSRGCFPHGHSWLIYQQSPTPLFGLMLKGRSMLLVPGVHGIFNGKESMPYPSEDI